MTKIGVISDTHGYIDDRILHHFKDCDQIWHAGDVGSVDVIETLENTGKVIKGVYGNIDNQKVRAIFPEYNFFTVENKKVLMLHIAGYPGRYNKHAYHLIKKYQPDIFVCGHSHILKIQYAKDLHLLHINPGAAGIKGFHKIRTIVRFAIDGNKIENMEVIELGARSRSA
ncbi:MAG TPA: YfcE family phosphodiesterase [Flavobacteriales bacterium]|nr:YfcE family phosphodiesterase [Flavobacteriales bacterium]|tara:strand:- start:21537 stop:22046 length:510 start_codon:yes stop_codon:yes gene_type:complete